MRDPLEEILGRAAIGIALIDTNGRYLRVNDRYASLLGYGAEQLLALRLQDVTHPNHLAVSLEAFIRAIESGAPLTIEQHCVRGDGTSIWLSNTVSVVGGKEGKPEALLVLALDVTSRRQSQRAASLGQSDLRMLLDSAADGFYCIDREGLTTVCNAAFVRMLGFAREEDAIGRDLHDIIHHSRPDGSHYAREDCPIYKVTQSGIHVHVTDEVFFRIDGTSFPVEYWARPIERDGEIHGAVCTFVDLTERKQIENRQELLNRELAHRVKNTLAMVQAIVGQTLRTAATPRDAMDAINQRLVALGNAHTILMRTRWGNASMMDVVEGATAIHRPQAHRFQITGPRIDLGGKAALAITMALHELCTNAAKYGSLSNESGTVRIEWSVTGGASDSQFQLSWQERGGPPVEAPKHKGFGSRLIAQAIGSDLRGEAKLTFAPDGVHWTLKAPVVSLKQ